MKIDIPGPGFRHLNSTTAPPSNSHSVYYTDKGKWTKFEFLDGDVFMDVNTLDLVKCSPEKDLPMPLPVIPQFPLYSGRKLRAISLNVTHNCSLACDYCYLQHFYQDGKINTTMPFEIAKRSIDSLFDWPVILGKQDPRDKRGFTIGFFGGEPLLNFELVKKVVTYVEARTDRMKFNMTTNAVLITSEIAKFLTEHNFTSVIVSLDGPERIHNHHRKFKDGSSSFQAVMKGIDLLNSARMTRITFRGTFLPDLIELSERVEFLNQLCDEGRGRGVSVEPACLTEGCHLTMSDKLVFTEESVANLESEYLKVAGWLSRRINEGKKARFHNIMVYVKRLMEKKQYATQCGAAVGYMAVNPEGDCFGCHREMSSYIGNLEAGGISEQERAKWIDNRYYNIPRCLHCDLRNVCGGPCREHNITATGCISVPDGIMCKFYHNWIKSAVKVIAKSERSKLDELYAEPIEIVTVNDKTSENQVRVFAPPDTCCFVREAGGYGDIFSMAGAATQLKAENPKTSVILCIPNDFESVARHLEGVDDVAGLGPVSYLSEHRRARGEPIDRDKYAYLVVLPENAKIVDLWCPGFAYEKKSEKPLEFTRSQIFAQVAGCKDVSKALPSWKSTEEERRFASKYIVDIKPEGALIGLAPRGTDENRSLSGKVIRSLVGELVNAKHTVIYFDCVYPPKDLPVNFPDCSFSQSVAIAEMCDILITVDSAFLHVGAAIRIPTLGIFTSTDPLPYKKLYPHLIVVGYAEALEQCPYFCNRSSHKGYTEKCEKNCLRKKKLNLDMILPALPDAFKMSFDPQLRKKRIERLRK